MAEVSMTRVLCSNNIPSDTRPDSADWCNKRAGHTGDHVSRLGRRWTDADEREARGGIHD